MTIDEATVRGVGIAGNPSNGGLATSELGCASSAGPTPRLQECPSEARATATTLADVLELPEPKWRIRGLLEWNGMLIVGGPPKRGKSRLVLSGMLDCAKGLPVWGAFPVDRPLRVMLYNAEGGLEGLRLRRDMYAFEPRTCLQRIFVRADRPQFAHGTYGAVNRRLLAEEVATWQAHEIDIVVLDPLVAFHGVDENNNTFMHRLLDALRDAIRAADAALILVHHEAKPAELPRMGGARLRGASAIHGAADNIILMLPEKDGKVRLAPEFKHSPPPEGGVYEGQFDERGRFAISAGG